MIIAVTGTGTGIGKTHLACALVGALRDRGARAIGWKPVESGVDGTSVTDEQRLREAAGFEDTTLQLDPHDDAVDRALSGDTELVAAAPPTLQLRAAVAPNVAARLEGVEIDAEAIAATLHELAARWDVVVLELAGGLFSPLTDTLDNAHFLAPLGARIVVVAPDRLGVLHDATATVLAASTVPLALHDLVLVAPELPDASTGTNAAELERLGLPIASVPRAPVGELRRHPAVVALAGR